MMGLRFLAPQAWSSMHASCGPNDAAPHQLAPDGVITGGFHGPTGWPEAPSSFVEGIVAAASSLSLGTETAVNISSRVQS